MLWNVQTTIQLNSFHSKAMLKMLQGRLQQYVNQELPDTQAGFQRGKGTRDQIANIHWIMGGIPEKHLLLLYSLQQSLYRNGMDLTEAEDIKKRWQEYTEELYKKGLNDPDNHDGVITHLEPDILECEVKGALGINTTNKASGGDGIPAKLFQILEDDAVNVLHSICQQIWKPQQWPQDWKRSVFIQSQKAMPKNTQNTAQLHSFHMQAR